jgi:hypothetical protein
LEAGPGVVHSAALVGTNIGAAAAMTKPRAATNIANAKRNFIVRDMSSRSFD